MHVLRNWLEDDAASYGLDVLGLRSSGHNRNLFLHMHLAADSPNANGGQITILQLPATSIGRDLGRRGPLVTQH